MQHPLSLILFFLLSINLAYSQNTIHVPADVTTIQEALNVSEEGTTILVESGTYFENLVWPEDVDGIKLIGENGPEETILDGGGINRVILIRGDFDFSTSTQTISSETLIEGFTLQNGYVNNEDGAGIFAFEASPILRNLIVRENLGEGDEVHGGGVYANEYGGMIEGCQFLDNRLNTDSSADGSGLYLEAMYEVEINNCLFNNNHAQALRSSSGGGMHIASSLNPFVDSVKIKLNKCVLTNNSVSTEIWSNGGGINAGSSLRLIQLELDSCIISDNKSDLSGGGISNNGAIITISNSSIQNNTAQLGAGINVSPFSFIEDEVVANRIINTRISRNKVTDGRLLAGSADTINGAVTVKDIS